MKKYNVYFSMMLIALLVAGTFSFVACNKGLEEHNYTPITGDLTPITTSPSLKYVVDTATIEVKVSNEQMTWMIAVEAVDDDGAGWVSTQVDHRNTNVGIGSKSVDIIVASNDKTLDRSRKAKVIITSSKDGVVWDQKQTIEITQKGYLETEVPSDTLQWDWNSNDSKIITAEEIADATVVGDGKDAFKITVTKGTAKDTISVVTTKESTSEKDAVTAYLTYKDKSKNVKVVVLKLKPYNGINNLFFSVDTVFFDKNGLITKNGDIKILPFVPTGGDTVMWKADTEEVGSYGATWFGIIDANTETKGEGAVQISVLPNTGAVRRGAIKLVRVYGGEDISTQPAKLIIEQEAGN